MRNLSTILSLCLLQVKMELLVMKNRKIRETQRKERENPVAITDLLLTFMLLCHTEKSRIINEIN